MIRLKDLIIDHVELNINGKIRISTAKSELLFQNTRKKKLVETKSVNNVGSRSIVV